MVRFLKNLIKEYHLDHNKVFKKLILWRIVRVSPISTPAWDRTRAALARSKCLNHYPVVTAYFWHVQ